MPVTDDVEWNTTRNSVYFDRFKTVTTSCRPIRWPLYPIAIAD